VGRSWESKAIDGVSQEIQNSTDKIYNSLAHIGNSLERIAIASESAEARKIKQLSEEESIGDIDLGIVRPHE